MYRVYLVDDEQPMLQSLVDSIPWLENGFELVGSGTKPHTAVSEIQHLKPDAVFTDLKMPGMNGIELFKTLRAGGVDAEFVILSAFDDYPAVREFFLLGGVDYILKPLDNDNAAQVLEKVSRKLAEKRHQTPSVQFVPSPSRTFDELVKYVTANFSKKHTLENLSARFNLNPTYICDLFARQYNSTLVIFVTSLRMSTAARLILENEAPLKEIAVFCGYQDYNQFARIFKQHYGRPPSRYKPRSGAED